MGRIKNRYRVENTNNIIKLSEPQKEVLYYLTEEFLSVQKIAKIRKCRDNAVYKIITSLKKKGIISHTENNSFQKEGKYCDTTTSDNKKTYRLHGQSFTIEILYSSQNYENLLKTLNKDELDNNKLMLYEDKIVIYLKKDFEGDKVDDCVSSSLDYISKFIIMLENNYKILLKKYKICKIKQFRGEIAKVGDILAKEINLNEEKLKIFDEKGQLRIIVDKSFNFDELEAVNLKNHIQDMQKIEKYYKDIIMEENLMSPKEMQQKVEFLINIVGNLAISNANILKVLEEIKK